MFSVKTLVLVLSGLGASLAAPAATQPELEGRTPADYVLHPDSPLARRFANLTARQNPSYTQDYTTGGTVNFNPTGTGFTLNYNVQQDFVVGVGWNPGNTQYVSCPLMAENGKIPYVFFLLGV